MTQTGKQIMYLIIDNTDQSVHREPNKKSYASTQYKTITEGINTPHYMSTLSESYWSA